MGKMDEMILVAPRDDVFKKESLTFQGVYSEDSRVAEIMAQIEAAYREMRRGDAEEDPRFKQPIPYVVIKREDEVFLYERLAGGGESRLHNKLSLGFGGHMNAIEGAASFAEVLKLNTDRELEEELQINEEDKQAIVTLGLINDDENSVGKVHIGILSALQLKPGAQVEVKEKDQIAGKWMKVSELKQDDIYNRLETWSQFVVDILV
ncbi:hypothetical protein QI003_09390 [Bacillus stercoris]|uniref:hypothetical protein n=1 Tax=Bacillus TaxID=1386 RepID=UPI00249BA7A4|nr:MULTISPECIES: hypothetical protein [Bacillus]MDN0190566.1 hypothetical protein [Bacillus sp. B.PNR1]MDN3031472.1 hypothetical protein [Bacillus sp. B.PNR2]WGV93450.1 hypothetical protein QI003_12815 [Bacillus stercoris]WGV97220.1 hypothetical protein QI003_09390 [Bacillus stercoris]